MTPIVMAMSAKVLFLSLLVIGAIFHLLTAPVFIGAATLVGLSSLGVAFYYAYLLSARTFEQQYQYSPLPSPR